MGQKYYIVYARTLKDRASPEQKTTNNSNKNQQERKLK